MRACRSLANRERISGVLPSSSIPAETVMHRIQASRRARLAFVSLIVIALAGGGLGYAVLFLSTATAPGAARLSAPPTSRSSSASSGAGPVAYRGVDGPWVVAPEGRAGFVGYRAREILGFDFVRSPNDAVARTTDVMGSLTVQNGTLVAAEISANVESLRSDIDVRDSHIHEFLALDQHPNATFKLSAPIDGGIPVLGRIVDVQAHGDLTILNTKRGVVFPLQARWNGDSIQIAGQLVIKRSDFNMDIPQLLGFRVAEDITVELELLFVRPVTTPGSSGGSSPAGSPPATSSAPPLGAGSSPGPSEPPDTTPMGTLPAGGGEIAFTGVTDRGGNVGPLGEIFVLQGGRKSPVQLTDTASYLEDEPAWSADGRHIAYVRYPETEPPELWVMDADGSHQRVVGPGLQLRSPRWSPDGRHLVAVPADDASSSLVVVDVTTGQTRTLLDDPGSEDSPDWSPDGKQIVFTLLRRGGSDEDLYLINVDGSGMSRLTSDPGYEYSARWSPNGQRIVFVRQGDVWVIDPSGGHANRLTSGLKADSPSWSPDGRRIVFVRAGATFMQRDERRRSIWIVNSDGSGRFKMTFGFSLVAHPAWRP
jgi:Tol biopolymer transport system component/polyisoprenoid-binding protein YceI